jgi:hypothetical protein
MAGEWIPLDCNLGTKPEVLELVDETGLPVEVVCWRLIQLWSWAVLNTADGTIRATPRRVAVVAGGDEAFWLAVERAGWVSFLSGTLTIAGWDKRFSNAAKARALHARRQDSYRRRPRDGGASQGCDSAASPEERRGEEKREEIQPAAPVPTSEPAKPSRSRAKSAVSWTSETGWEGITAADRQEWATAYPGAVLDQELAKATSWLKANPTRAGRRNWRAFLVRWLARCQDKGGSVREPGRRPEDKPPPRAWTGRDAEAFALTRKLAEAKRLKEEATT